jgi:hypothetical protein
MGFGHRYGKFSVARQYAPHVLGPVDPHLGGQGRRVHRQAPRPPTHSTGWLRPDGQAPRASGGGSDRATDRSPEPVVAHDLGPLERLLVPAPHLLWAILVAGQDHPGRPPRPVRIGRGPGPCGPRLRRACLTHTALRRDRWNPWCADLTPPDPSLKGRGSKPVES